MYPEITIKIAMSQEGVNVSQEQSSASSDDFTVPVLPYGYGNAFEMEAEQEYAVPSIANEEIDLFEEYSVPELSLLQEETIEDEYSVPVPDEEELDDKIEVPKE